MNGEYDLLIEEVQSSKLDSDQFIKIMMLKELQELNRNLRNIDLTLWELYKK